MIIEATFLTDDGDKEVVISSKGVEKNELLKKTSGYMCYVDADHPMANQKFQLDPKYSDRFLKLARNIYQFECEFNEKGTELKSMIEEDKVKQGLKSEVDDFYTDFVIHKYGDSVHFKRMSAGERKIATLLSCVCNPLLIDGREIIGIDNVELHIYWERHPLLVDCLLSQFPEKQFLCTTHSGTLINYVKCKLGEQSLYDIDKLRRKN
jgi:predicted ATP-binding protein involved in virulence